MMSQKNEGIDILYNQLEPKWKWFKPPLSLTLFGKWEISFMWAYKIHKSVLLKDCVPIGISSGPDENDIELEGM